MGFKDRIKTFVDGGPNYQARKKAEAEAKKEALEAEMAGYKAGLKTGAKQRGIERGIAKGRGGSGIGGFMANASRGMKAFEAGAGGLIGDMNFDGMGQGLNSDFSGIGGFGASQPKKVVRVVHVHKHYHKAKPRRRGR